MRGCSPRRGASLVKVGFAGTRDHAAIGVLADAAVSGARSGGAGVVLVAYADRLHESVSPATLLDVASSAGAAGVLLDTADKRGPRLTELVSPAWLTTWVADAHRRSLTVARRGPAPDRRLADLCASRGADVAGVRGAACTGGREGHGRGCATCALSSTPARPLWISRHAAIAQAVSARRRGRRVRAEPCSEWLRADARSGHRQLPPGRRADRRHEDRGGRSRARGRRRRSHRRLRHDRHARLHRHAPAHLGRHPARTSRPTRCSTSTSATSSACWRRSTGRRTPTPATWSARSAPSTPASRRCSTGRTSRTRRNTPTRRSARCRNRACARVFAYGTPNLDMPAWWHDSSLKHPHDIKRVAKQYFSSRRSAA